VTRIPPSGSVPRSPPPAPAAAALPVFATVVAAFRSVLGEGSRLVLRSAAWFGILLIVSVISLAMASPSGFGIADLVSIVVSLAAYASLAVAWHRAVILGETPQGAGDTLRFGAREFRFLGILLLAVLIVGGPTIIATFTTMTGTEGEADPLVLLLIAAAVGWTLFAMARFTLAFPLSAIDATPAPLRTSWQMSQRIWPRILAAGILAAIPFAVAGQLLGLLARGVASLTMLGLVLVVITALSLVQVAVMSALASHIYLHLAGRAAAPPPA
jgi:hypothetical protein